MKNLLLVIFIFFIILLIPQKKIEKEVIYLDDNLVYRIYYINFNNISLDKYKDIFSKIDENYYQILDIKFMNNYSKKINKEIDSIKISASNYIDSMNEYINKCSNILYKYDIESELSRVRNGNMLISSIKIYTTSEVYEKIKKDA